MGGIPYGQSAPSGLFRVTWLQLRTAYFVLIVQFIKNSGFSDLSTEMNIEGGHFSWADIAVIRIAYGQK